MLDKENGEIWHFVDGKTNKPVIRYPKAHSWKTSLHSFEHALFGYMTASRIKGEKFELYLCSSGMGKAVIQNSFPVYVLCKYYLDGKR